VRRRPLAAAIGAAALAGSVAVVASSAGQGATPAGAATAPVAIPLISGVTTATQSSVLLPMGHLNDPANTFWELFLRPAGSTSWTLQTPKGVADNGGLVVAEPPAGPVTVGFLPSALLRFSPLAQSTDGGRTWSPGSLSAALVAAPDALAGGPTYVAMGVAAGDVTALVSGSGQSVQTSSGDLSTWRTVATTKSLAKTVRGCGVQRISAVAANAAGPILGVQCRQSGRIGVLFPPAAGSGSASTTWTSGGPLLTGGTSGTATVLRLEATSSYGTVASSVAGLTGLAGVQSGGATSLVAFWSLPLGPGWTQSTRLTIPSGWTVWASATGGGSGRGIAVLLGSGSRRRIVTVAGPGAGWVTVPSPPSGTGAVATVGTETDAFVVSGSGLSVWALTPGSAWSRTQTATVPIPYGSSS